MSGLIADKLGSYGPAFYMAGSAYIVASLTPCLLHCVRTRETTRKELSPSDTCAEEFELRSHHGALCTDGPSKETQNSNDRKPVVLGHQLFVSTV